MTPRRVARPALALALLSGAAFAQSPQSAPPQGPSPRPSPAEVAPAAQTGGMRPSDQWRKRVAGYLAADAIPNTFYILPPPPTPGSREPAELVDRRAFESTRKLLKTPRGALATRDADESAAAVTADFDCVFGLDLSPATAPALLRLLNRVRSDAGMTSGYAKNRFQHWRPFVSYGGPVCDPDPDSIAHSWSYPSGHTTMSWAYGLILAELAPDLATPILARARSYGESRVVCGVHTVSDIEEGRTTGSMVVAALHANAEFKADLEAARLELQALRAKGGAVPAGRQCAVEREAMASTPWLPPKRAEPAQPGPPPKALPKPLPPLH